MNILLSIDAGGEKGLGHYFRSMHLAEILREKGHSVSIAYEKNEFWDSQLHLYPGIRFFAIASESDLLVIGREQLIDVVYIDAIRVFHEDSILELRSIATVIFYQNISASRHLADIFILPSLHQQKDFFEHFTQRTKVYQGLEYAIFNKNVLGLEPKTDESLAKVTSVSVLSGGSDPANVLMKLYRMIDHTRFQDVAFRYNIGASFLHRDTIPENVPANVVFASYDYGTIISSQLVVAAFGVTSYELLALGMPVISVGHQSSTTLASEYLSNRTGALNHIGLIDTIDADTLNGQLALLTANTDLRLALSGKAKQTIDRNGIYRVADIIEHTKSKRI